MFKDKEYIICSAIWFDEEDTWSDQPLNINSGFVMTGRRHHNCFNLAFTLRPGIIEKCNSRSFYKEGFLTNTNKFLDRKDAVKVAFDAGQIDTLHELLISEHLYYGND